MKSCLENYNLSLLKREAEINFYSSYSAFQHHSLILQLNLQLSTKMWTK